MSEVSRNLLSYPAEFPRWLLGLVIGGSVAAAGAGLSFMESAALHEVAPVAIIASKPPPAPATPRSRGREPASVEPALPQTESERERESRSPGNTELAQKVVTFGIGFCIAAGVISALILVVSVPVFLFSSDERRVARAAGLVKTTLGFFVASGGAIIATISFSKIL